MPFKRIRSARVLCRTSTGLQPGEGQRLTGWSARFRGTVWLRRIFGCGVSPRNRLCAGWSRGKCWCFGVYYLTLPLATLLDDRLLSLAWFLGETRCAWLASEGARFGLAFDRAVLFPRLGRVAFVVRRFATCAFYRKLPILSRSRLWAICRLLHPRVCVGHDDNTP
jgi:hypothetical protein